MNVSISRERLESLLSLAEVATKLADSHDLDAETSDCRDVIAEVRSEIEIQATMAEPDKAKLHQTKSDVRHPYYEMGDKLAALEEAIASDPVMMNDPVLCGILRGLRVGHDVLFGHLGAKYRWD